jgi:branched-chain amino acid transport system substrate-binding protein
MIHRWSVVGISVAAACLIAGCGGSSSSSSSSAAASGSATKAPYVLGVIASESGPLASTIGSQGPTIQAWGKWENAHGGIDGHPVKIIVKDDAGNPATALTAVKQMVEQDHIIALINVSGSETAYASYTKQANVPVVGGNDGSSLYETNGNFFSQGPSESTWNKVLIQVAKQKGLNKIGGMYCAEIPACQTGILTAKSNATALGGISVVSEAAVSSSATDYTAPCLKAKGSGANSLMVSAATTTQLDVATSCARQGLQVPLLVGNVEMTNAWLKVPAANGSVSVMPIFPFIDSSNAGTQAFQTAMSQYLPALKRSDSFGAETASAWTSAELFAAAASAGRLGNNPTTAGIFAGLYALKNDTLDGISAPLNYVKGADPNVKNKCAFVMEMTKGKFVEPQGMTPTCAS